MCRRVLLVLFAVVCVAAGCRGSTGLVEQPPAPDPDLAPPISVDPAPDQIAGLVMALRATLEKAPAPLPEISPLHRSACPGTAKRFMNLGCYLGWCVELHRTACGEILLRLSSPDGQEAWFHNGLPMMPPV